MANSTVPTKSTGDLVSAAEINNIVTAVNSKQNSIVAQAAEADISTADATDLPTAQALANATKVKVNALLAKLRTLGLIAP